MGVIMGVIVGVIVGTKLQVLIDSRNATQKSDVWSFGVVLFEISVFCTLLPFPNIRTNKEVRTAVLSGFHLSFPNSLSPRFVSLAKACFAMVPSLRPSFVQLFEGLVQLENLMLTNQQQLNQLSNGIFNLELSPPQIPPNVVVQTQNQVVFESSINPYQNQQQQNTQTQSPNYQNRPSVGSVQAQNSNETTNQDNSFQNIPPASVNGESVELGITNRSNHYQNQPIQRQESFEIPFDHAQLVNVSSQTSPIFGQTGVSVYETFLNQPPEIEILEYNAIEERIYSPSEVYRRRQRVTGTGH
eukprot:TRINITY_DN1422_c0_g2_i1.p1 TRINITY_DN1422_c0_g2~~TRINITY_DN1422_c0_g2_i1.p1  ORF type:complete len:300 (-),score=64.90 TRINITY_DN1422_c0_g2_i1:138-1037(-)